MTIRTERATEITKEIIKLKVNTFHLLRDAYLANTTGQEELEKAFNALAEASRHMQKYISANEGE